MTRRPDPRPGSVLHEQEYAEAGPSSVVDGRYAIKREIARGAMGIVFEATHLTLRRPVAMKTLTPAALDWSAGAPRLMREARILSLCKHPNVVEVHDAGVCSTHGPFIALEMLEARSLSSYLVARQRLDVATVARLGEQLCSAVTHVHDRGIVHRDIKPSNILITRAETGPGDSLRLIDFGIACIPRESDVVSHKLTALGEVLGTVEYMAPELLLQQSGATHASDLYAIGVLLFECLTGTVPFPGQPTAIISAHAARSEPPAIDAIRKDLPVGFADAIRRAMSPDPAARLESADALRRACLKVADQPGRSSSLLEAVAPEAAGSGRRQPRAPYSAPARLITRSGPVDGRTEDISEGGVLVVVAADCAEGENVQVRFPLPSSGRVLVVDGVARWTKSLRGQRAVGLAFSGLPDDAALEIRGYADIMSRR